MNKPYVVSSDLGLIWSRYANKLLSLEGLSEFRRSGKVVLGKYFGSCDWIPEDELREGLESLLSREELPMVSLDAVYTSVGIPIDITRVVNGDASDAGYGTRMGGLQNLTELVHGIVSQLPGKEVVLIDDVIFSGSLFEHLIDLFASYGVRIVRAYAGVAVSEGIARIRKKGCAVRSVRQYKEVVDEICERDFMPGTPLSGRTVLGRVNTGMPYLLPFGRAGQWASFPSDHERTISMRFLSASKRLYRDEPELNGMKCRDLVRGIWGVAPDETPVLEVLRQAFNDISGWVRDHD